MPEAKEKKATPLTEELLLQKGTELIAKEAKLNSDIKEFEDFQEKVHQIKEDNDAREEAFQKDKADFESRVEEFNTREKDLNKKEKDLAKKSTTPKEFKSEPGLDGEFEGEEYKFLDSAPKIISINGKGYSQKEIFDNPELALELIGGNSGLIIKKQ